MRSEKDQESSDICAGGDEPLSGIVINSALVIPESELSYRFSRSSGPGGQHVNRSETRVELLFDVGRSASLTDPQRNLLMQRLGGAIDNEGVLHLVSSTSRSQADNRADVVSRFAALLAAALRPRKKRVPTRPSGAQRERRLREKRTTGLRKRDRQGGWDGEE